MMDIYDYIFKRDQIMIYAMNCRRTTKRLKNKVANQLKNRKIQHKKAIRKRKPQNNAPPTDFIPVPLPVLKISDNEKILSKYANGLRNGSIEMDDLNLLQRDLETLVTTCAVRHRILVSQFKSLSCDNKNKKPIKTVKRKRGRPIGSRIQLNRKRQILNDIRQGILKKKIADVPAVSLPDTVPAKHKVPITSYQNNSASDFWKFIEPFCADITNDDLSFLDELIRECSQEIDTEIPPLAENYALKWSDELIAQYHNFKVVGRARSKHPNLVDAKKGELNMMIEKFSSPMSERLLASIMEEKVVHTSGNADIDFLKDSKAKPGDCLVERLRNELIEQEILEDELPKQEDEILKEIKKCQAELFEVNNTNIVQLNKLRDVIAQDRQRQAVKEALDEVDKRIMEIYNDILLAKQNHISHGTLPAMSMNNNIFKKYENEAFDIIKKQIRLHKEIIKLTNSSG